MDRRLGVPANIEWGGKVIKVIKEFQDNKTPNTHITGNNYFSIKPENFNVQVEDYSVGRLGMICNDGNNPGLQIIFTDFRNCTCVLQPATWFAIKTLSV